MKESKGFNTAVIKEKISMLKRNKTRKYLFRVFRKMCK